MGSGSPRGAAQHPPDPVQRVMLAAPVPRRLLLHPAPHVVHGRETEPGDVERVQHPHRGGQLRAQRRGVAAIGVQRRGPDLLAPRLGTRRKPGGQSLCAAARHHVEQPRDAHVDDPDDELGPMRGGRSQGRVSSTSSSATPSSRAGLSTSAAPYSRTAVIAVPQPTPNAAATCATECPSCPTRRRSSRRARSVSDARARMCSEHHRRRYRQALQGSRPGTCPHRATTLRLEEPTVAPAPEVDSSRQAALGARSCAAGDVFFGHLLTAAPQTSSTVSPAIDCSSEPRSMMMK